MMDVINVYFYFFIVTSSNMYRELILKVFFEMMSSRLYKFVTFLSTAFTSHPTKRFRDSCSNMEHTFYCYLLVILFLVSTQQAKGHLQY